MTPLSEQDRAKLPPPAQQQGLTYAKDIRPLFEASCFRCHGDEKQKGDLRLDSLEAILQGGEDGKVVVPGDSAKSLLVMAVSGLDEEHAMPPKRKPGGLGGPRGAGGPGGRGFGGPGGQRPPGEPQPGTNTDPSKSPPPSQARPGPGTGGNRPGGGGPGGGMSKPLTPEQVGFVRAWIDQGAK